MSEKAAAVLARVQQVLAETPVSQYAGVEVGPNQIFRVRSANSHFPTVTLNSGSIFEIGDEHSIRQPIRLEIGRLVIKPNGPAALLRLFDGADSARDGERGESGARGVDGRRGPPITNGTPGGDAGDGENGVSAGPRGLLYLAINEIEIIPDTPLTKAILEFDAKGEPGGRGGDGGLGGPGGHGFPKQNGSHKCDWSGCWCTRGKSAGGPGANGGAGGYPGNGGDGGDGAAIYFAGPAKVFEALSAVVELAAGAEGMGGTGGDGGSGGIGASAATGGSSHCGRDHPAKPNGMRGESRILLKGKDGAPGKKGALSKVSSLPSYGDLLSAWRDDLLA